MKDTMIVMQNESLAMRVMELEAELEILRSKQHTINNKQTLAVNNNPANKPSQIPASSSEILELKKKLAEANDKYRNVTTQYGILKNNNSFPVRVKGLRRVAYVYARYGLKGTIKKIWLKMRGKR